MKHDKFDWRLEAPRSNSKQAYDRLRAGIMSGRFTSGERVTETGVAALLGVSRTPVREAFARLLADGLLRTGSTGATEVVDPREEAADIRYLREAIEGCAARLAAARASAAERAQIEVLAHIVQGEVFADFAERARTNERFHLAIAQAAHAPRVARLVGDYRTLFVSGEWLEHAPDAQGRHLVAQHKAIAAAIRLGNADEAERAMRLHLRYFHDADAPSGR